jgi:hypothetical protein
MIYLEPKPSTIKLLQKWSDILTSGNLSVNQGAFNQAVSIVGANLNWRMASFEAFPPGFAYFRDSRWKQRDSWVPSRKAAIVHNNWIVGKDAKRQRFIDNDLWHPSGELRPCGTKPENSPTVKPSWPPLDIVEPIAKERRLVVAAVNCGYLDFADNWIESVKKAGVTNFVLIALDNNSYAELSRVYPRHTIPPLPGTVP